MRFLPNIRYGTERYPEKVARRLRAVNITAWLTALVPAYFAFVRFIDPEQWRWGFLNLLFAVAIASIPLLHRFGPVVAPVALAAIIYLQVFRVVIDVGTADGAYLTYVTATVLFVLLIGIERVLIAVVMAVLAASLMITLHLTVPYNTGVLPMRSLNVSFIINVIANLAVIFAVVYYAARQTARAEAAVEREYQRSETLLGNILPPKVAARLKERSAATIADRYDDASILFADMAGFTARASDTAPDALVRFLDDVFTKLDRLVERHGLEKIKTTGDAYMVVSGVPEPRLDHAAALAALALDMRDALTGLVDPKGRAVPVRIGIASGPVVAGVVGRKKFFYDVWGDAVNMAARMEQTGEPGTIQLSPEAYERLKETFELAERGIIDVRGKGAIKTWLLVGRKAAADIGPPAPAPSSA